MSRSAYLTIVLVVLSIAMIVFPRTFSGPEIANFGGVPLHIEYARTKVEQARGLGGRTHIPADYGMLFIFSESGLHGFWMKDTLVPLDIFWLDEAGRVVSVALEVSPSSYPTVFYPSVPARAVLETAAGFGRAHAIATGTPLLLKKPESVLQ